MQLKPIAEQVVVIVGASGGIGRETALRFAGRGAKLAVSARDEPGLRSLVEEIRRGGGEATAIAADVSEFDQVRAVADKAAETYGRIDTWVQLAAVSTYATFEQTTPREWKRIIDVNLNGQAYGAMAALPHLRRTGRGALIHVSSVEAKLALPLQSAYASSKHGMHGFLKSLRLELRHEGIPISVTEVMPSSINTPFFNKALTKLGVKPMPSPPIYQPGVVADAIVYAAERPVPEIVAGGAGKAGLVIQRISPGLIDAFLLRTSFESQRTEEPKSEDAPDNLFAPLEGYDYVEGDFSDRAKPKSVYTWLATRPAAGRIAAVALLGAVTVLAARRRRN